MMNIEIADIYIKMLIEDNDFDGKKFEMVVKMSGPLSYLHNDFESEAKVKNIEILRASLDGKELETNIREAIADEIRKNLFALITICTNEEIKLDKDGLIDIAYEVLADYRLLNK